MSLKRGEEGKGEVKVSKSGQGPVNKGMAKGGRPGRGSLRGLDDEREDGEQGVEKRKLRSPTQPEVHYFYFKFPAHSYASSVSFRVPVGLTPVCVASLRHLVLSQFYCSIVLSL